MSARKKVSKRALTTVAKRSSTGKSLTNNSDTAILPDKLRTLAKNYLVMNSDCGEIDQLEYFSCHETLEQARNAAQALVRENYQIGYGNSGTEPVYILRLLGKVKLTKLEDIPVEYEEL